MLKQNMILRSVSLFCSAAILAGSTTLCYPAYAATPANLAKDIQDARVLAPGTRVRVRIDKDKALVSTFRNQKANDKDCKIEAVLIGKTIFDKQENGVNSITVYFYDATNPSKYKSITVSKGDVAAFGTGQVSKSELLSSIQIHLYTHICNLYLVLVRLTLQLIHILDQMMGILKQMCLFYF